MCGVKSPRCEFFWYFSGSSKPLYLPYFAHTAFFSFFWLYLMHKILSLLKAIWHSHTIFFLLNPIWHIRTISNSDTPSFILNLIETHNLQSYLSYFTWTHKHISFIFLTLFDANNLVSSPSDCLTHSILCLLKGTVQRDFRPPVFFIIPTGLGHWLMG